MFSTLLSISNPLVEMRPPASCDILFHYSYLRYYFICIYVFFIICPIFTHLLLILSLPLLTVHCLTNSTHHVLLHSSVTHRQAMFHFLYTDKFLFSSEVFEFEFSFRTDSPHGLIAFLRQVMQVLSPLSPRRERSPVVTYCH